MPQAGSELCQWATCAFSVKKCLFKVFPHLLIGLLVLLMCALGRLCLHMNSKNSLPFPCLFPVFCRVFFFSCDIIPFVNFNVRKSLPMTIFWTLDSVVSWSSWKFVASRKGLWSTSCWTAQAEWYGSVFSGLQGLNQFLVNRETQLYFQYMLWQLCQESNSYLCTMLFSGSCLLFPCLWSMFHVCFFYFCQTQLFLLPSLSAYHV